MLLTDAIVPELFITRMSGQLEPDIKNLPLITKGFLKQMIVLWKVRNRADQKRLVSEIEPKLEYLFDCVTVKDMKFTDWSKEEQENFLKPQSSYEERLREVILIESYEYDWKYWKFLNSHEWIELIGPKRNALNLTHGHLRFCCICKLCGKIAYGRDQYGSPSTFLEDPEPCLTDDERLIKDIIE